jgi:hypothetical protein
LETFDYGVRRFDIVVFWDVLEHLRDPQQALSRATAALRSGGLLIIKGPILKSTKSLITRLTPWRVHVLFYRYVLGSQNAGKPGYAPFPTEHASDADDDELRIAMTNMRLKEVFYSRQVSSHVDRLRDKALPLYWLYEALSFGMRVATASHCGSTETDFLLVGRKVR